jgi:hypothetical protein
MDKIHRGTGVTPSERILADLGDQTFLNLWSYPNLFIDKKKNGRGDGKELCDLLIVCGGDVIIFSDKTIAWQDDKPIEIAWPRFYRKAVVDSVEQIRGADRWITQFPERIFTDPRCTQRLPISLPADDEKRVHGIVVAGGAYKACQNYTKDDSGSFMIAPFLKGDMHVDFTIPGFLPFSIGDPHPDGMFIHVFDDVSIKTVLRHLDTISDFTRYLNKRAAYIRSGQLIMAHGEEELLGRYLTVAAHTGKHDFEPKRKKKFLKHLSVTIQGEWSTYLFSNECFSKTLADEVSYVWDRVINLFVQNVIDGTSVAILGETPSASQSERALRFMALESRFSRRLLGEAVSGALKAAGEAKQDRFTRLMLPTAASNDPTLAYVLMILAYPTGLDAADGLPRGYEQYREARASMLQAYCLVLLSEQRQLKTAVGIAVDASSMQTGRPGGSEDLVALRVDEWTDQLLSRAADARERYDVLRTGRLVESHISANEYPSVAASPVGHRRRKRRDK